MSKERSNRFSRTISAARVRNAFLHYHDIEVTVFTRLAAGLRTET